MSEDTRVRRTAPRLADLVEIRSVPPSDRLLTASDQRALALAIARARGRPAPAAAPASRAGLDGRVSVLCEGYDAGTAISVAASLAAELGLRLYRVDVRQVVSQYIGETEKNLGAVFDFAAGSGAILLLDEADALFGKRSDVKDSHDKYANQDVSYLLQRMERHPGLVVLATNRPVMDEAGARRFTTVLRRRPPRG